MFLNYIISRFYHGHYLPLLFQCFRYPFLYSPGPAVNSRVTSSSVRPIEKIRIFLTESPIFCAVGKPLATTKLVVDAYVGSVVGRVATLLASRYKKMLLEDFDTVTKCHPVPTY